MRSERVGGKTKYSKARTSKASAMMPQIIPWSHADSPIAAKKYHKEGLLRCCCRSRVPPSATALIAKTVTHVIARRLHRLRGDSGL